MHIDKACPVVLRQNARLEILAFVHPLAGCQIVKGSVEPGETSAAAATRELMEEAGIQGHVVRDLGSWSSPLNGQTWAFHECAVAHPLPEQWAHFAQDDGGHEFQFFWHPLDEELTEQWHPIFQQALLFLRQQLTTAHARPI